MYKTAIHDFNLKRGGTFNPSIKIKTGGTQITDWTGWTFLFNTPQIKPAPTITPAPDGSLAVNLPRAQSQTLHATSYEYNLELTDPNDVTGFPIAGHILVSDPGKR